MEFLLSPERPAYRWWTTEWVITYMFEEQARRVDPSIQRLPLSLARSHPVLRRYIQTLRIPPWDVWGYLAPADGPWPERRLVALFTRHPAEKDPIVLCLDGPRASQHRFPDAERTRLCLYYPDDPPERKWQVRDGLVRLFDLGRQHVLAEHIARERGGKPRDWPTPFAPHGGVRPAKSNPSLALPPELPGLDGSGGGRQQ